MQGVCKDNFCVAAGIVYVGVVLSVRVVNTVMVSLSVARLVVNESGRQVNGLLCTRVSGKSGEGTSLLPDDRSGLNGANSTLKADHTTLALPHF